MDPKKVIFDQYVQGQVDLDRFAEGMQLEVRKILKRATDSVIAEIVKQDPTEMVYTAWKEKRLILLSRQVKEIMKDAFDSKTLHSMFKKFSHLAKIEVSKFEHLFNKTLGVDLFRVQLTEEMLSSLVENTMINGQTIGSWWKSKPDAYQKAFAAQMNDAMKAIQTGLVRGEAIGELVRRVKGTPTSPGLMKNVTRETTAFVRTSVHQVAQEARMMMYRANADLLKGYQVSATLDARTTPLCQALDGCTYDLNFKPIGETTRPYPVSGGPPFHWQCRSTLIPILKTYEELKDAPESAFSHKSKIKALGAIPEGVRASMGGPVPAIMNYGQWLKTQPLSVQKEVLGPTRLKLWQEGKLTLSDLVHQNGRPLTIEQLEAKVEGMTEERLAKEAFETAWKDPDAVLEFTPETPVPEGFFKPIENADDLTKKWEAPYEPAMYEPKKSPGWGNPSDKKPSAGIIVMEEGTDKVWIVEPKGHFGGYQHTFPKGGYQHGANSVATAIKETWEETGLQADIWGYLGDFEKTTSNTRYFIGVRSGGSPLAFGSESQAVKLVPIDKLDDFLNHAIDKDILKEFRIRIELAKKYGNGDIKAGLQMLDNAHEALIEISRYNGPGITAYKTVLQSLPTKLDQSLDHVAVLKKVQDIGDEYKSTATAFMQTHLDEVAFQEIAKMKDFINAPDSFAKMKVYEAHKGRVEEILDKLDEFKETYGTDTLMDFMKEGENVTKWIDGGVLEWEPMLEEFSTKASAIKQEISNGFNFLVKAGTDSGQDYMKGIVQQYNAEKSLVKKLEIVKNQMKIAEDQAAILAAQAGEAKAAQKFQGTVETLSPEEIKKKQWESIQKAADDMKKKGSTTPAPIPVEKLRFEAFEQYGSQQGSNFGGFYHLKSDINQKFYIKFPPDPDRAYNEVIAARLYQAAGVEVPEVVLIESESHGLGVASRIINGVEKSHSAAVEGAIRAGLQENFAVDAWLSNWDVVGLEYDNVMLVGKNRWVRIDPGGALRFRAQGGLKGQAFGNKVLELESLLNPGVNPQSAAVFNSITTAELENGVRKVLSLTREQIVKIVNEVDPRSMAYKDELIETLVARQKYLAEKFPHLVPQVQKKVVKAAATGKEITEMEIQQIVNSRGNGFEIKIDKDEIEDMRVLFWEETLPDGSTITKARFKLHHDGKILKAAPDAVEESSRAMDLRSEFEAMLASTKQKADVLAGDFKAVIKNAKAGKKVSENTQDFIMEALTEAYRDISSFYSRYRAEMYANKLMTKTAFKQFEASIASLRSLRFNFRMIMENNRPESLNDFAKDLKAALARVQRIKMKSAPTPEGAAGFWSGTTRAVFKRLKSKLENGHIRRTSTDLENLIFESASEYRQSLSKQVYRKTVGDADVWIWGEKAYFAESGTVEITWAGSAAEKANSIFKVLDDLTIPSTRPSYLEQEMVYLRQIAYRELDRSDYRAIMSKAPKALSTEEVAAFRRQVTQKINPWLDDMADLPDYNPIGSYQAFETGTKHWEIPKGLLVDSESDKNWDWIESKYLLHHRIYQEHIDQSLDLILSSGGNLISTTDKLRRGVPWGGMSPGADYSTGGASYVFTRIQPISEASNNLGLCFRPSLLRRTDAVSYAGDMYGNVTQRYIDQRLRGIRGLITGARNGSNETIFKGSISLLDNLVQVNVRSATMRARTLEVFRKHGIFEVNGIKIEDLVRVVL